MALPFEFFSSGLVTTPSFFFRLGDEAEEAETNQVRRRAFDSKLLVYNITASKEQVRHQNKD